MTTPSNILVPRKPSARGLALQRFVTKFHIAVYRLTGGIIGHHLGKVPCLLLSTIGRKTGKTRITPLLYVKDGKRFIVIASNGGSATDPIWWRNLQVRPTATIQVGRQSLQVRASLATPDERTRLWEQAKQIWPGYEGYQQRTAREIPVVVLQS